MKPSIGRVVHYKSYGTPGGEHKSEPQAAIITGVVGDDTVHLCVLYDNGMSFKHDVKQGSEGGQWDWPPRV